MRIPPIANLLLSLLLVTNLVACSSTPNQESTGEFFDNSLITAKVKTKLINDKITGGFSIKVRTYKGVVQLNGYVNSELEKKHAAVIVSKINGVKGIKNALVIRETELGQSSLSTY